MTDDEKIIRKVITVDRDMCTGCKRCIKACPTQALVMREGRAELNDEKMCDGYGSCIAVCPYDALSLEEKRAEPFDWGLLEELSYDDFMEKMKLHYNPYKE